MRRARLGLAGAGGTHEERGASLEAMATCSIWSMRRLKAALRVSMPDLRKASDSCFSWRKREAMLVVLGEVQVDDGVGAGAVLILCGAAGRLEERAGK